MEPKAATTRSHVIPLRRDYPRRRRRGFTLIESLVATALIGVIVIAVISSVSTAQSLAFEGQKMILASMAADDLMLELVTLPYDELKLKHNLTQAPGTITSLDGQVYPGTFWAIGRSAQVVEETITEPTLGVMVKGLRVTVTASDEFRSLATLETFIAEPAQ
jgi:prepilin-type N-terminal cleavage/methylation domain-containing protein